MSIDIIDLDLLAETDPLITSDLDELGLARCAETCVFTCLWTCGRTAYQV